MHTGAVFFRMENCMGRKRKLPDGMETRPGRDGYYANFQVGGRRVRKLLGTDYDAACHILAELKAKAYKQDFNIIENDQSLAELRKLWLGHCRQRLKPSTVERYEQCLDHILPNLGVQKVSQVTVPAIVTYRQHRLLEEASPRTVNAEVQALGCMLNWAVDPAKLIGSNPISALGPLPHDNPKEARPLSPEEMTKLFKASPLHWQDVWYAYGVTGMRASELIRLEYSSEFLDWDNREIIIPKWLAKNRQARRIPMDDRLYEILRRREKEREQRAPGRGRTWNDTQKVIGKFTRDRIFVTTANTPLQRTNLYRTFIRCCRKAGIEVRTCDGEGRVLSHVDLHSLRRTFITEAISNGGDPATVQQLAGHKTLKITMNVYHKSSRQTKRLAISKLPYGTQASGPERSISDSECHHDVTTPASATQSQAV